MRRRVLIGIAASVAIILVMLWLVDPRELLHSLADAELKLILLVLVLYLLNLTTKALRWFLLVRSAGTPVPFRQTLPIYVIALGFNNVTPGKLGGEPVRAYLLKKEAGISAGQTTATIFAEKIMDLTVIATMAMVGAFIIMPRLSSGQAAFLIVLIAIMMAGIVGALLVVSHSGALNRTVNGSMNLAGKAFKGDRMKRLRAAVAGFVDHFRDGMKSIGNARGLASAGLVLSVIIWTNEALRLYIIILALPQLESVGLGAVFIASSIANILGIAIPLGAGNILGISVVFAALGVGVATIGAASFIHVATSVWISVPLCVIAMIAIGFSLPQNSKTG